MDKIVKGIGILVLVFVILIMILLFLGPNLILMLLFLFAFSESGVLWIILLPLLLSVLGPRLLLSLPRPTDRQVAHWWHAILGAGFGLLLCGLTVWTMTLIQAEMMLSHTYSFWDPLQSSRVSPEDEATLTFTEQTLQRNHRAVRSELWRTLIRPPALRALCYTTDASVCDLATRVETLYHYTNDFRRYDPGRAYMIILFISLAVTLSGTGLWFYYRR